MSKLIRFLALVLLWLIWVMLSTASPQAIASTVTSIEVPWTSGDDGAGIGRPLNSLQATGDGIWRDIDDKTPPDRRAGHLIIPRRFRLLEADMAALDDRLAQAPPESNPPAPTPKVILPLPLPDGTFGRFRIEESPVFEPALAAQYPAIKTYRGFGLDDPTAVARLDRTPAGFHAMILSASGTVYIDPYRRGEITRYISYAKRDYDNIWGKQLLEDFAGGAAPGAQPVSGAATSGPVRRTYRLAVAATGEYTQFHGGSAANALAAIVTTVNRVTGIYEREVAVRLTLIGNNNAIIYTNPATDPYTNGSPSVMISQNQTNLDAVIGSANYDIGHVFGTNSGGLAGLGVVCANGAKGQGVTGSAAPVGDPFDVDFVAHEMGHQFGANHTFNATNAGSCSPFTRNGSTAYEPGGGTTIMAYAGICDSQDLQPNSDDYFHGISFDEIVNYITLGGGSTCGTQTATGNAPPLIEAGPNYTIPQDTPFALNGSGSDPNGHSLTFIWEEFDLGSPPGSSILPNTDSDGSARPIFRSRQPGLASLRTFPDLSSIFNGLYSNSGEALPDINRTMTFRLTGRDNNGGVANDTLSVAVDAGAGPFRVTQPNGSLIWNPGSQQTIAWNVANTTAAPVSCANVNILLSEDGGESFSTTLVANTPNDGSEIVTIPDDVNAISALVKVECAGNIFFDISDAGLTICSLILNDDHEDGFADWSVSNGGSGNDWQPRTDGGYSGSNYWFVADVSNGPTDSYLDSAVLNATDDALTLRFFHRYDLEQQNATAGWDGAVVEINVNNGGWVDVGENNFTKNGYNVTINTGYFNPLAGRRAFSGDSEGYLESIVDLSSLVDPGDTFQIRFREANDTIIAQDGWYVDDVTLCSGVQSQGPEPFIYYFPLIFK